MEKKDQLKFSAAHLMRRIGMQDDPGKATSGEKKDQSLCLLMLALRQSRLQLEQNSELSWTLISCFENLG